MMVNTTTGEEYESLSSIDADYKRQTVGGRKLSPPAFDSLVSRYRKSFMAMESAWLAHEYTMLAHNERRANRAYRRAIMEHAATLAHGK